MAGLSFLYSFFNLYTTGGGQGVPTVEEAMMDIESCMAVLEYLTRKSQPPSSISSYTSENPIQLPSLNFPLYHLIPIFPRSHPPLRVGYQSSSLGLPTKCLRGVRSDIFVCPCPGVILLPS
jgi:hypothetical protein